LGKGFSLCHHIQNGSKAHPASGYWRPFHLVFCRSQHEADHSHPSIGAY
jgi:hypothetical protein